MVNATVFDDLEIILNNMLFLQNAVFQKTSKTQQNTYKISQIQVSADTDNATNACTRS